MGKGREREGMRFLLGRKGRWRSGEESNWKTKRAEENKKRGWYTIVAKKRLEETRAREVKEGKKNNGFGRGCVRKEWKRERDNTGEDKTCGWNYREGDMMEEIGLEG